MHSYSIDQDDFNPAGLSILTALHERFAPRCREIFLGRNRNVFDMGTYVVKVPKNLDGIADNDWEGSVSNDVDANGSSGLNVQYARTRMADIAGIPVVFMEHVEHASTADIVTRLGFEPDWVGSVDCGQVGFTRNGRLVAYDYGMR